MTTNEAIRRSLKNYKVPEDFTFYSSETKSFTNLYERITRSRTSKAKQSPGKQTKKIDSVQTESIFKNDDLKSSIIADLEKEYKLPKTLIKSVKTNNCKVILSDNDTVSNSNTEVDSECETNSKQKRKSRKTTLLALKKSKISFENEERDSNSNDSVSNFVVESKSQKRKTRSSIRKAKKVYESDSCYDSDHIFQPKKDKTSKKRNKKERDSDFNYSSEEMITKKEKTKSSKQINKTKRKFSKKSKIRNRNDDSTDDDDDSDWEVVEDMTVFDLDTYNPSIPDNIVIKDRISKKTKKKKGDWIAPYVRQQMNRVRTEIQVNIHNCHLLYLMHRIQYLNSIINNPIVKALGLSISPPQCSDQPAKKFLQKYLNWFKKEFQLKFANITTMENIQDKIVESFETKIVSCPLIGLMIFIAILRQIGFNVRLCYFLNPVTFKPMDLIDKFTRFVRSHDLSTADSLTFEKNLKRKRINVNDNKGKNENPNWYWLEIFDEQNKKWISFGSIKNGDSFGKVIDDPYVIGANIKSEISYIIAIDNDSYIHEVTVRYANDWFSPNMKRRRLKKDWWTQTLKLLKRSSYTIYEDADVKEFDELAQKVKIPEKISEIKCHPLFVLKRFILKTESLYPPDAPPVGFFKDEPVYSRSCVHSLKSRQTWLHLIRSVKAGEQPYKIIPGKSKFDNRIGILPEREMRELFGEWQTVPYEAPTAQNGIVPRNSFGNVDLYDPCMLPKGTVYLNLPRISNIAAKLGIDCAPAVLGFDCNNHRGFGARPVLKGYVICKEFEEKVMDIWNAEQERRKEKDQANRNQRIMSNWKRLIKGMLIKTKLQLKYGTGI